MVHVQTCRLDVRFISSITLRHFLRLDLSQARVWQYKIEQNLRIEVRGAGCKEETSPDGRMLGTSKAGSQSWRVGFGVSSRTEAIVQRI